MNSPAVLAALSLDVATKLGVNVGWVTTSVAQSSRRALAAAAAAAGVRALATSTSFLCSAVVIIPASASAAQFTSMSAGLVAIATATSSTLNAMLGGTASTLVGIGCAATVPSGATAAVAVNGVACSSQCAVTQPSGSSATALSTGAIVGIVIGCAAALAIIVAGAVLAVLRRRRQRAAALPATTVGAEASGGASESSRGVAAVPAAEPPPAALTLDEATASKVTVGRRGGQLAVGAPALAHAPRIAQPEASSADDPTPTGRSSRNARALSPSSSLRIGPGSVALAR